MQSEIIIGIDNGLSSHRRQVIIWTNVSPVQRCICAVLGGDKLMAAIHYNPILYIHRKCLNTKTVYCLQSYKTFHYNDVTSSGKHRCAVNSPHKGPVTRKMFPFDDVIVHSPTMLLISTWNTHVGNASFTFHQGFKSQLEVTDLQVDCVGCPSTAQRASSPFWYIVLWVAGRNWARFPKKFPLTDTRSTFTTCE